jgi:methyl-accepting chemotaxis protein
MNDETKMTAEQVRRVNEEIRRVNEEIRRVNEEIRRTNDEIRKSNEEVRKTAEITEGIQEAKRETNALSRSSKRFGFRLRHRECRSSRLRIRFGYESI